MSLLNIPNTLTFLRLCTAPVIAALIVEAPPAHGSPIALGLFVVAGALDKLDGVIARRWNLMTEFGAIADPIVDKVWLHTVNVALLSIGAMPLWVVAVFLARDFVVAELRGAAQRGGSSRAAHWLGKMKMRTQTIYAALCIAATMPAAASWANVLALFVLALALYFTAASLLHYAQIYTSRAVQPRDAVGRGDSQ
ncbi:MAG: CDP-diacylglycerol--glycerol-3-phosphate 3-phosphatidyltransferase [Burkholderiaceae bacterium]|jgi:CDP-diacylglycerol--glycerol-3-phosphate 3-phosphatidyltransferase|nr:CDP-diacylglycerol--glycerol-3-phosphate 3-phosphatidyltransferase [Burkholderiaceae bacterium]